MALMENETVMTGCSLIPSPSPRVGRESFPSPSGRGVGEREQRNLPHPPSQERSQ